MEQTSDASKHESDQSQSPTPPQQNKLIMFLALGIGLFIFLSIFIGGLWGYIQGQKNIQSIVQSQVQELTHLQTTYDDIRDILDETPSKPSAENVDLLDTSKNDPMQNRYDDVLGVEEELGIDQKRILSQEYKTAAKHLETLKKNNRKIEALGKSNPFVSILIPQNADLIKDTDRFSDVSMSLLSYLQAVNTFELNSIMVGYQIGLAIQEAISRSADDESVSNLEKKIQEIDTLNDEFKVIDITDIPKNLQSDHSDELASFDEDIEIFNTILVAFQEKDVPLIQKTLQSLIIQGQGASNESKVEFKTFWHEND